MEKENLGTREIFEKLANQYFEVMFEENEQSEKLVEQLADMMQDDNSLIKFYNSLVEKHIKTQRRENIQKQLKDIF